MNAKPWSVAWWTILLSTVAGVIAGLGAVVDMLPDTWRPTARIVIAVTGIVIALVLRSALFDSDGDGTPDALERPTQAPPPPTGGSVAARAKAAGIVIVALCVLAVPAALLLTSGCGGAVSRVAVPVACSSLMLAVGEDSTRTAERAHADIDQVAEVCARFPVDGGAP
jgi:Flp pilus assembly protein TadB